MLQIVFIAIVFGKHERVVSGHEDVRSVLLELLQIMDLSAVNGVELVNETRNKSNLLVELVNEL
jgi:hypothetical protein